MQVYDLIMLIVLLVSTILGAIKGFAWQVASLASIVVSYFVACRFRFQVAEMIHATPPWNQFLAMLILYVGSSFVIWVGFRLLSGLIDQVRLKEFDRHLGAAFGLTKGLLYCLLITMFGMSLLGPQQQAAICQSKSGYYIASALDHSVGVLPKEVHDVVGPYLARLDTKLKDGRNGIPNNDSLLEGLPSIPGFNSPTAQFGSPTIGQGGESWFGGTPGTTGNLMPNSPSQEMNAPVGLPPVTVPQFGNGATILPPGNTPSYPDYPADNRATQSAQQLGTGVFPR